jgi:hypothetical protein
LIVYKIYGRTCGPPIAVIRTADDLESFCRGVRTGGIAALRAMAAEAGEVRERQAETLAQRVRRLQAEFEEAKGALAALQPAPGAAAPGWPPG